MSDIVVEVRKGMVTGLYCDLDGTRFVVVDWDLVERADSDTPASVEYDYSSLAELPADTLIDYKRAIIK